MSHLIYCHFLAGKAWYFKQNMPTTCYCFRCRYRVMEQTSRCPSSTICRDTATNDSK